MTFWTKHADFLLSIFSVAAFQSVSIILSLIVATALYLLLKSKYLKRYIWRLKYLFWHTKPQYPQGTRSLDAHLTHLQTGGRSLGRNCKNIYERGSIHLWSWVPGLFGNTEMPVSLMEQHQICRELFKALKMNVTYGKSLAPKGLLPWAKGVL